MAYTDPLTGLGNLYRLRDKVRQIAKEREEDPAPFAIGIANLDGFKPINDLFGPRAGDEILCQVAHRLKACIPDGATVTRHGGDEFAFVLPKGSSLTADVSKAIEALRADGTLEQLVQTWLADQGAPFLS